MSRSQQFRLAWWSLVGRHFGMAKRLLPAYADGACFHMFHAVECAASASLLKLRPKQTLSIAHDDKLPELIAALPEGSLRQQASSLAGELEERNQSLYVSYFGSKVRRPQDHFRSGKVESTLRDAERFVEDLRTFTKAA